MAAMKGDGNYNKNSSQQKRAIEKALRVAESALDALTQMTLPLPAHHGQSAPFFTIADYGSSQGSNSVIVFQPLIARLRKSHPTLPVLIVHEDLSVNDWTTVFETSTKATLNDKNVYVVASGTSFYEQLLPPSSVDFAFSGTAFHWQNFPLPEPLNPAEVELAANYMATWTLPACAYRDRFQQNAFEGWDLVVKHRSVEMKPGARGVFLMMSVPLEPVTESAKTLNVILRKLVENKLISREEAIKMKLPIFGVPKEKLIATLQKHGFEIESYEHFIVPDTFLPILEKNKDENEYASCVVNWIRAFSEPTIASGIPESRRSTVVDAYYSLLHKEVIRRIPERLNWVAYANHLVAVKRTVGKANL